MPVPHGTGARGPRAPPSALGRSPLTRTLSGSFPGPDRAWKNLGRWSSVRGTTLATPPRRSRRRGLPDAEPSIHEQDQDRQASGLFASRGRDYSETVAKQIDDEVRKFILDSHEEAKQLLTEKRETLEKLATALLERETLDAEDVDAIVKGRDLQQKERVVIPTYADREKAAREKRRAASIFGAPKPATG